MLCYPRILGHVFNPLSVWFCEGRDGALKAVIYEVHNTYDERHAYVLPVGEDQSLVRHGCPKAFYVSPFLSPDCRYQFRIRPPGEDVAITIQEEEAGAPILNASFAGARRALTDAAAGDAAALSADDLEGGICHPFRGSAVDVEGVRHHPHAPQNLLCSGGIDHYIYGTHGTFAVLRIVQSSLWISMTSIEAAP